MMRRDCYWTLKRNKSDMYFNGHACFHITNNYEHEATMIWTFYAKKICEHLWTFDLCLFRKFACKECVVSYLVLLHLCQCFVEVTTPKLERVESLV